MGHPQRPCAGASGSAVFYRLRQGRHAAALEEAKRQSRYLADLIDVLQMCAGGIERGRLRQFMPPASLEACIATLLDMGLIECGERPPAGRRLQQQA